MRNGARIVASSVSFAIVNLAIIVVIMRSLGLFVFAIHVRIRFARQPNPSYFLLKDSPPRIADIFENVRQKFGLRFSILAQDGVARLIGRCHDVSGHVSANVYDAGTKIGVCMDSKESA